MAAKTKIISGKASNMGKFGTTSMGKTVATKKANKK